MKKMIVATLCLTFMSTTMMMHPPVLASPQLEDDLPNFTASAERLAKGLNVQIINKTYMKSHMTDEVPQTPTQKFVTWVQDNPVATAVSVVVGGALAVLRCLRGPHRSVQGGEPPVQGTFEDPANPGAANGKQPETSADTLGSADERKSDNGRGEGSGQTSRDGAGFAGAGIGGGSSLSSSSAGFRGDTDSTGVLFGAVQSELGASKPSEAACDAAQFLVGSMAASSDDKAAATDLVKACQDAAEVSTTQDPRAGNTFAQPGAGGTSVVSLLPTHFDVEAFVTSLSVPAEGAVGARGGSAVTGQRHILPSFTPPSLRGASGASAASGGSAQGAIASVSGDHGKLASFTMLRGDFLTSSAGAVGTSAQLPASFRRSHVRAAGASAQGVTLSPMGATDPFATLASRSLHSPQASSLLPTETWRDESADAFQEEGPLSKRARGGKHRDNDDQEDDGEDGGNNAPNDDKERMTRSAEEM